MLVEKKHPQDNRRHMKIALVYASKGQSSAPEMFSNTSSMVSKQFISFVHLLGEQIKLEEHDGYVGDMGKRKYSTSRAWVSPTFHLVPLISRWRGLFYQMERL